MHDMASLEHAAVNDITVDNDLFNVVTPFDFLGMQNNICFFSHADPIFTLRMTRSSLYCQSTTADMTVIYNEQTI